MESIVRKHVHYQMQNGQWGFAHIGALAQPRGWDGVGDGREVQEEGDTCVPTAD